MEREAKKPDKNIGDDISLLKQLTDSLDEAEQKLEEFYKKKDAAGLSKAKKFMINIIDKISELTA
jgi:uncharacterized protein YpuA (DUF1002 family)